MMRRTGMLPVFLVAVVALILGASFPNSWAGNDDGDEMPFKDAEIFIEFNSTDEDAGIQVFLDGDDWRMVTIEDPNERTIFKVQGKKTLGQLGLTELFFESVEPELTDLPLEEFLAMFPEGDYEFEGITNDGIELESEAEFTHVIPCGPVVSPDEANELDPDSDIVIEWVEVTSVIDPETEKCEDEEDPELELEIDSYTVIIESEDSELAVILPAEASSLKVPSEIIDEKSAYKFEVLAKEESGNQTITESFFCTGSNNDETDLTEEECAKLVDDL